MLTLPSKKGQENGSKSKCSGSSVASSRPKLADCGKTGSGRVRQNTNETLLMKADTSDEEELIDRINDLQEGSNKAADNEDEKGDEKEEVEQSNKLRWSTLTVREYPYVLGDNVTVMGPPISICWDHQDENTYDVKEYEEALGLDDENNEGAATPDIRRTKTEMKMPSRIRTEILMSHGHTKKEIRNAIKMSEATKEQRKMTVRTLKLQKMDEFMEKFNRKVNPMRKIRSESNCSVKAAERRRRSASVSERTTSERTAAPSSSSSSSPTPDGSKKEKKYVRKKKSVSMSTLFSM